MNRLVKAGDRDSVEESRYQGPKRCSATITFASQFLEQQLRGRASATCGPDAGPLRIEKEWNHDHRH